MISEHFVSPDEARNTLLPADFDHQRFLREYWQQRPLLIRANGVFEDPLTPEELAGLACEDFVESRLVSYLPADDDWVAEHGPFSEERFLELPESNYSLLVQAVDQWHPGVRNLLKAFSFLPGWRLDDIMVNYSTDGGNVGPHFDHYDVFLVQGLGAKRWQLGQRCDSSSPLRNNRYMKLLREFASEEEVEVGPGDILYLPPGLAHYGQSVGPSLTYSVGFRAPSAADLLQELAPALADSSPDELRFRDQVDLATLPTGEIPAETIEQLKTLLHQAIDHPAAIQQWFAHYMTSPRYPELQELPTPINDIEAFKMELQQHRHLHKAAAARFAWIHQQGIPVLFADGRGIPCKTAILPLMQQLCDSAVDSLDVDELINDHDCLQLALELYNQGSLLIMADYYV